MKDNPLSSQVVIQLPGKLLKGHLAEEFVAGRPDMPGSDLKSVRIRLLDTREEQEISLLDAKAIFFVRNFNGELDHADLRFHDGSATLGFLWVRLTFDDGEILEGMIENSCDFVMMDGIWVTPTDPTGNNWLVYALKSQLRHFEVLGLRQQMSRRAPSKV
jgi:hypothetical protein